MIPQSFDEFWSNIQELAMSKKEIQHLKQPNKSIILDVDSSNLVVGSSKNTKGRPIPKAVFLVTWKALFEKESVTGEMLSSNYRIKNPAFVLALLSNLDYIEYIESENAIRIKKD